MSATPENPETTIPEHTAAQRPPDGSLASFDGVATLITVEERRRLRVSRAQHLATARALGRALRALALLWLDSPRGPHLPADLEFSIKVTREWVRLLERDDGTSGVAPSLRLLRCQAVVGSERMLRSLLPGGSADPRVVRLSPNPTRTARQSHEALMLLHRCLDSVRRLPA